MTFDSPLCYMLTLKSTLTLTLILSVLQLIKEHDVHDALFSIGLDMFTVRSAQNFAPKVS